LSTVSKYNLLATRPWVYHSLFWLCYYLYGALISLTINQQYDGRFYAELLTLLPPDMLLVYVNLYWLRPAFLNKRKYLPYVLTVLITMSATSAINIYLHHLYSLAGSAYFGSSAMFSIPTFATQLLNSLYLLGMTSGLKFFKDWLVQQQKLKEKERQQIALELDFLKAQIHPHFFFNTLNNLYSLTLQKSDLAPEAVLKLSSLMSYMLYESGAATVALDKEIANLEDYIGLEQLRFGSRLALSFCKVGLAKESVRIPPLLLLTFVENSFKHGIGQTIGEGRIDISLKRQEQDLVFAIVNSVGESIRMSAGSESPSGAHSNGLGNTHPFVPNSAHTNGSPPNGLGLRNVIRRLDLLYGDRYRLDRGLVGSDYHVTLKIPLS
jgi:sensor histidine kinase YesM